VNALDWVVGLSESGLEERTIDFVRGPTPLKAMALEKSKQFVTLHKIPQLTVLH
jgi:hypothetical protein